MVIKHWNFWKTSNISTKWDDFRKVKKKGRNTKLLKHQISSKLQKCVFQKVWQIATNLNCMGLQLLWFLLFIISLHYLHAHKSIISRLNVCMYVSNSKFPISQLVPNRIWPQTINHSEIIPTIFSPAERMNETWVWSSFFHSQNGNLRAFHSEI